MPWRRGRSAIGVPTSCSRSTATIWDSVHRLFLIGRVSYEPFGSETHTFRCDRSGLFVIDVSLNDSSLRQRFTVAHEIGHAVLHLSDNVGAFVDSQTTFSRTVFQILDKPMPKTDTREMEANRFAAAFLMPQQLLTEAVQTSQNVPELARRFQVSQHAMQTRLTSLKIS